MHTYISCPAHANILLPEGSPLNPAPAVTFRISVLKAVRGRAQYTFYLTDSQGSYLERSCANKTQETEATFARPQRPIVCNDRSGGPLITQTALP